MESAAVLTTAACVSCYNTQLAHTGNKRAQILCHLAKQFRIGSPVLPNLLHAIRTIVLPSKKAVYVYLPIQAPAAASSLIKQN